MDADDAARGVEQGQEGHGAGRSAGAVVDLGVFRAEPGDIDAAAAAIAENTGHLLVDIENGFDVVFRTGKDVAVAHGSAEFTFAAGAVEAAPGGENSPFRRHWRNFGASSGLKMPVTRSTKPSKSSPS